ncbi:MAG: LAGLIDADG family homing endonuclease, partial [Nanoarchaeota archaeon]
MCVDGDTEVRTTEGTKTAKSLYGEITANGRVTERKENLEVVVPDKDFFVYALDNENKIVEDRIHHAFRLKSEIYRVKLSNGSEVRASHNQPFLIKGDNENKWIPVKELTCDELAGVVGNDGVEFANIESIESLGEGEVFDFAINPYSNFIGGNPANVILHNSKFYGESLTPDETIFTIENGHASLQAIGDVVKSRTAENVAEFDDRGKIEKGQIKSFIEHPFQKGKKIYEVTTSTGRKIKVTDYHSLFALKDGKIADVKTADITPNDTYLAIPSILPAPETYREIDILKELADSDKLNIRSKQIKDFIKSVGIKKSADILDVTEKYVYDIYGKNVCVSIKDFLKLAEESVTPVDYESVSIVAKQNAGSLPAKITIDEDMAIVIGLFLAEGSYTTKDAIRITNELPESKEVIRRFAAKYGIKLTEYQDDMLLNSKPLKTVFEKILGIRTGAENKEITKKLMSMPLPLIKAMLRGYFTGDGSVYPPSFGRSNKTASYTRAHTIEGSTHSKKLANSLMYTLLYFGIVAKCSTKIEKYNGKLCYRVLIQSPEGFAKFSEIGFLDGKRNERISNYLNTKKFNKSRKIPIWPELRELIKSNQRLNAWSNSKTIGKDILKEELTKIDPQKEHYGDAWNVIDSDLV